MSDKDKIDLLDDTQIYFDIISTSINGLHHIASISDQEQDIQDIAASLDHASRKLKALLQRA